jgi:parallel beta-helix repeat protein
MSDTTTSAHEQRSRARGTAYLLVFLTVAAVGAILTLAIGRNHQAHQLRSPGAAPARASYIAALDPVTAAEQGVPPGASEQNPLRSRSIRAIKVFPTHLDLVAGGRLLRSVATQRFTTLAEITKSVADPDWITSRPNGAVVLNAALIVEHGAGLAVGPPATRQVLLADVPGVFLGANGGTLHLDQVSVSSLRDSKIGSHDPSAYRPFVLATNYAYLTVKHSTFSNLGWDWNGSYGVSWMSHSHGHAYESRFTGNYIGIYTDHVGSLLFRGNTIQGNELYGLDPHSRSENLVVADNTVVANASHGVIFSDNVHHSAVYGNTVKGNGQNGIMMDANSANNLIRNNRITENRGDGIVLSNSPSNRVSTNEVEHNRVGIHVANSAASQVSGNTIRHNDETVQGVSSDGNTVPATWNVRAIAYIWSLAALILVALQAMTWTRVRGTRRLRPLHTQT